MMNRQKDAEVCPRTKCGAKICGQPIAGIEAVAFVAEGQMVVTHLMCAPAPVRKAYHEQVSHG